MTVQISVYMVVKNDILYSSSVFLIVIIALMLFRHCNVLCFLGFFFFLCCVSRAILQKGMLNRNDLINQGEVKMSLVCLFHLHVVCGLFITVCTASWLSYSSIR